jgi:Protein of unknown function (DUF3568)
MTILKGARTLCMAMLVLSAPACAAALVGAGAAGAVAWTDRGAESTVNGTVTQNWDRATAVFQQMGITQTGQKSEDNGTERTLMGTKGDTEVTVTFHERQATTTKVEVTARRNMVDYDKNMAKDILTAIVNRT